MVVSCLDVTSTQGGRGTATRERIPLSHPGREHRSRHHPHRPATPDCGRQRRPCEDGWQARGRMPRPRMLSGLREARSCLSALPRHESDADGRTSGAETIGVRDDGTTYVARVQAFPVYGSDGHLEGFIEVVEDITDRKREQDALRRATFCVEQAATASFGSIPRGRSSCQSEGM